MTTDLATLTPSAIDRLTAEAEHTYAVAATRAQHYAAYVERYGHNSYGADAAHYAAEAEKACAALTPLHAEYSRRPWARYWLVANVGGHVHTSRDCHTCFADTQYAWQPELAGMTPDEVVEVIGATACTVCIPSAPTHPRFSDGQSAWAKRDAAAKAERDAEKAAKAAAKAAKAITAPDGTPLRSEYGTIKTERAARNEIVNRLRAFRWYGAPEDEADARRLAEAVAHKTGEAVEDVLAKARKTAARD